MPQFILSVPQWPKSKIFNLLINTYTYFYSVDKVSIPLNTNSKFVATETWLIKVTLYGLYLIKQSECALVATAVSNIDF